MSDGPIANYVYNSGYPDATDEKLGYNAVGPGWTPLLEALDTVMEWAIEIALTNSKCSAERLQDPDCQDDASIKVVQVKEKFGGLRVYWESTGLGVRLKNEIYGATMLAEALSFKICEKCGTFQGTETRIKGSVKFGRILTLCESCHKERDESDIFDIGNGDKV